MLVPALVPAPALALVCDVKRQQSIQACTNLQPGSGLHSGRAGRASSTASAALSSEVKGQLMSLW